MFWANASGNHLPYQWNGNVYHIPPFVSECPNANQAMHAVTKWPCHGVSYHLTEAEAEEAMQLRAFSDYVAQEVDPEIAADMTGYESGEGAELLARALAAGFLVKNGEGYRTPR